MRLADDRRARIPFALLGVLLLVSSATYATTLSTGGPLRHDDSVATAMDRASASTSSALRSAVKDAARDAARNPVTERADTPAGRALNESTPFRDALRIRVYLAAYEQLGATRVRTSGVVAATSLPPVDDAADLAAAKRRVGIEQAANGTALRVTVRNLTTTAWRPPIDAGDDGEPEANRDTETDGETVVASETETVVLTVRTPVLLAHQRTTEYERRLNREPEDGPGLGRQLTARLAPVVWARSAGQLANAPISNVLGNRHVEVTANGGALATQRAVFGRDDPQARWGLQWARSHVALQDAHAVTSSKLGSVTERTYPPAPIDPVGTGAPPKLAGANRGENRTMTVGVNRTADVAFADLLAGRSGRSFAGTLRGSYRTETRLRTDVDLLRAGDEPAADSPGSNWTLVDEDHDSHYRVDGPAGTASRVGSERFAAFGRRVTEHHSVVRTWRRGNETRRTRGAWRDEYRVRVTVTGEYDPDGTAPERPVRPSFERGGALDGPNLAGVPARATDRLLDADRDSLARRVADGRLDDETVVLHGDRPDDLRRWVYADLADLRERVRRTTVTVSTRDVALGEANPPALLAAKLRERRASLVDAPASYDGVADRARVAARVAYLDRVLAELDARADAQRETSGVVDDALGDTALGSADGASRTLDAGDEVEPVGYRAVGDRGPNETVTLVPDGSPGYLTLSTVSNEHVAAVPENASYRPLAARNINVFAVPYGDGMDVLGSTVRSEPTVDLRSAGSTLVAANRTLDRTANATLRDRRDRLQASVQGSVVAVARETRGVVVAETSLSERAYRNAVGDAMARWDGTGHRALAVANGSFAAALAAEVRARDDLTAHETDRLRTRLRVTLGREVNSRRAAVPLDRTNETGSVVRDYAGKTAEKYATKAVEDAAAGAGKRGAKRYLSQSVDGVPAGLPVAPAPGYWYATVNLWWVTVEGSYLRFTVRAHTGTGDGSGSTLQYVRDGSAVTLDVDDDGSAERLGRSERISFEAHAAAFTAAPGGRWVGDVDGNADERSSGWEDGPGCVRAGDGRADRACHAE
ncbi:DUF7286 family protein [Halogranum gelatinilyticum]|uniref:DUF7286 family protein n=1 Tax=Halogranum gelatinilyticum TaxID=660521 RepID=UPI00147D2DC6|nr:hypothetical protein [Halogranum gelatinilyticum]